jgi:hypothetical protein
VNSRRRWLASWMFVLLLVGLGVARPALAESRGDTSLIVYVRDASTNQPIFQARLTLQFNKHGGKLKKRGLVEYSAKTNPQGRYRFTGIPYGTIRLIVTAKKHQTYSQELELRNANQVISIKLKGPHPLL